MTDLIACLSIGKGTWGHVSRVIDAQEWRMVFLITNDFGKEKFSSSKSNIELIVVDSRQDLKTLIEEIKTKLKDKPEGPEVALNLASGDGKEHMALLSAIMQLGLSFRLVALAKDGYLEMS